MKIILMIILIVVSSLMVQAGCPDNESRVCSASLGSRIVVGIDPYIGVNESDTITAYFETDLGAEIYEDNMTVYILLDGVCTNMTFYNATRPYWESSVTSSIEEEIDFVIQTYSDAYTCQNSTVSTKFRIPFNVSIELLRSADNYTSADPYTNEFQYIYLKPFNNSLRINPYDFAYVDKMFTWMPFYTSSFSKPLDDDLALWGLYSGGSAKIKLYETGNYTVSLLSMKVMGMSWPYEFLYPQYDDDQFKSTIKDSLYFDTKSDYKVQIYIDMWEISKFNVIMNLTKWIVVVIIWLVLTFVALAVSSWNYKAGIGITLSFWTLFALVKGMIF